VEKDAYGNKNMCSAIIEPPSACFRGIYDGIIGDDDVENALDFAH